MGDLLLTHLMLGTCNDHICVRVSRFWDFYDPNDEKKLLHTNMVLVDEEGNNIHAQLYPFAREHFMQRVKEGNVYNFSYFRVRSSSINYKPVAIDLMLSFSKWTTIEEVVNIPPAFPLYTYSLASMDELQARVDSRVLCSDVIGVITAISSVGAIQTKIRQSESTIRNVTICVPSGAMLNVVLWGERATSFPAEEIQTNGQASPQVVIFVGVFVKSYGGLSLSGGSSCKWYINPDVPEAKKIMVSAKPVHKPVTWAEIVESSAQKDKDKGVAEEKKISDIINLNPFECKKTEFLVTVTIKKVDSSWWYNACKKCMKTVRRHGDSYKCTSHRCGAIGVPTQRFKLSVLAGDETGDTDFILFGRQAQRLTKKTADTLIADNPVGFIPDEITGLLEKTFTWSVSFTESTIDTSNICFQVNTMKVQAQVCRIPLRKVMPLLCPPSLLLLRVALHQAPHQLSHLFVLLNHQKLHRVSGTLLMIRTSPCLPLGVHLVILQQRHRKVLQTKGLAHPLPKRFLRNSSPVKNVEMTMMLVTWCRCR